jgi:hypothetical protein
MESPGGQASGNRRGPQGVAIASGLTFAVSALMAAWGGLTLSHAREFGAASYRFAMSHPDVDLAPGYFEIAFVTGAVLSIFFAALFLIFGFGNLHGRSWSRVLTWIWGCAALPFVYVTYLDYSTLYMFPGDTRSATAPMRALTPWRYSGAYYTITTTSGILITVLLVTIIVMLALYSRRRHRHVPDLPILA